MDVEPEPLDPIGPDHEDIMEESLEEEPVLDVQPAPEVLTFHHTRATSIRGGDKLFDSRGYSYIHKKTYAGELELL